MKTSHLKSISGLAFRDLYVRPLWLLPCHFQSPRSTHSRNSPGNGSQVQLYVLASKQYLLLPLHWTVPCRSHVMVILISHKFLTHFCFQVVEDITDICVWGGGWFPCHLRHRPWRLFGWGLGRGLRPHRSAFSKRYLQLGRNGVSRWAAQYYFMLKKLLITTLQSVMKVKLRQLALELNHKFNWVKSLTILLSCNLRQQMIWHFPKDSWSRLQQ